MPTSSVPPTPEEASAIVQSIRSNGWWQGTIVEGNGIHATERWHTEVPYWVVATQTCNLYSPSFDKIHSVELIAAHPISSCEPKLTRGDDPRTLHAEATSEAQTLPLAIDIQRRRWIARRDLGKLPRPELAFRDSGVRNEVEHKWLDTFIGWIARSYNRAALPDAFNDALKSAKLRTVLEDKLAKNKKEDLFGIYLSISYGGEEEWIGELGLMPPPYILGITLISQGKADPEVLKKGLIKQLFQDEVDDPESKKKITRAELARKYQVRLLKEDIEVKTLDGTTLADLKRLVRYSLVDHLSASGDVTPTTGN